MWVVVVKVLMKVVVALEGGLSFEFWAFKVRRGYQNWTSANRSGGGSKFWTFCDNMIIDCPTYLVFSNFLIYTSPLPQIIVPKNEWTEVKNAKYLIYRNQNIIFLGLWNIFHLKGSYMVEVQQLIHKLSLINQIKVCGIVGHK